jgi:ribosomal protein S18 acetylase RimI-like enzyme
MATASPLGIHAMTAGDLTRRLRAFASLLHAAVHAGASINFILPFSLESSIAFWEKKVLPELQAGGLVLYAASRGEALLGTVQLGLDTPPNQPHRAEVRKLMVHPNHRRQGIAKALMAALELDVRRRRRTLLTLDTRTGDAAEPLYAGLGYTIAGRIPGYCLDVAATRLDSTTLMYRTL